jgi:hypothetical protein
LFVIFKCFNSQFLSQYKTSKTEENVEKDYVEIQTTVIETAYFNLLKPMLQSDRNAEVYHNHARLESLIVVFPQLAKFYVKEHSDATQTKRMKLSLKYPVDDVATPAAPVASELQTIADAVKPVPSQKVLQNIAPRAVLYYNSCTIGTNTFAHFKGRGEVRECGADQNDSSFNGQSRGDGLSSSGIPFRSIRLTPINYFVLFISDQCESLTCAGDRCDARRIVACDGQTHQHLQTEDTAEVFLQ